MSFPAKEPLLLDNQLKVFAANAAAGIDLVRLHLGGFCLGRSQEGCRAGYREDGADLYGLTRLLFTGSKNHKKRNTCK